MSDIFTKLNQFESAVSTAWSYDTKLECQEDYTSSKQLKKCDEYHEKARQLKAELIAELKRLTTKVSDDIWEDRMGGQFTQEEIYRAQRGGEGW